MRPLCGTALLLLAACGGPEANLRSQDPYERFLGGRELVERTDAAAMTELVAMLEDPHFLVVTGAIEILAQQERPEFLQHYQPKVTHPHPLVRQAALIAIGRSRNAEGLPLLVQALKDPDAAVRRAALKGLWSMDSKPAVAAMVDAVADKDPSVSYMAHRYLAERTGKTTVERKRDAWLEALK